MKRYWYLIGTVVLFLSLAPFAAAAAPSQQGENLLSNPSFEGPYSTWNGIPQAQMPVGWTPWWAEASAGDPDWKNHRPEWKPAEGVYYPNRVHGGERALQWHKSYATFLSGAYQQVSVPANAQLRFSAYGQAWSCDDWSLCPDATSHNPASMAMRIGIDPTGGTNPWAASVVWSGWGNPLDAWAYFEVEAAAQGSQVTVFLYSNPDWPKQNQDVYYDDASLVVVGAAAPPPAAPPAATQPPGAEVPAPVAPLATATPLPDGSIVHKVQSGDTAWSVAARYGISVDTLYANNEIGQFLAIGQELLIRPATGEGESPEPAVEEPVEEDAEAGVAASVEATLEPEVIEEEAAVAEPAEPVAMAQAAAVEPESVSTGIICVAVFDDQNRDGIRDAGENLLPGIIVAVSDSLQEIGRYTTDGMSEPYCFSGLMPGSYQVAQQVGDNWSPSTLAARALSLAAGEVANLEFGNVAVQSGELSVPLGDVVSDPTGADSEISTWTRMRSSICAAGGVVGLMLLVGAGLFIITSRRKS